MMRAWLLASWFSLGALAGGVMAWRSPAVDVAYPSASIRPSDTLNGELLELQRIVEMLRAETRAFLEEVVATKPQWQWRPTATEKSSIPVPPPLAIAPEPARVEPTAPSPPPPPITPAPVKRPEVVTPESRSERIESR